MAFFSCNAFAFRAVFAWSHAKRWMGGMFQGQETTRMSGARRERRRCTDKYTHNVDILYRARASQHKQKNM